MNNTPADDLAQVAEEMAQGAAAAAAAQNMSTLPLQGDIEMQDAEIPVVFTIGEELEGGDNINGGLTTTTTGTAFSGDTATGTNAPAPLEDPVFVQLIEVRHQTSNRPTKSHRGGNHAHTYVIRFYLVDSKGNQHLAATGVDNGDSHYEYTNEPGFPTLQCHNKGDVKKWGDSIIAKSQDRGGFHTDVVRDEVPPAGTVVTLPKFISYSETKEELPDGRHLLRWYLMDDQGHNHLAVTGEEKDTRDGHYTYSTEAFFTNAAPLEAKNQDEVKKWIDSMLIRPQHGTPVMPAVPMALRTAAQRGPKLAHPKSGLGAAGVNVQMMSTGLRTGTGGRFSTPGSTGGRGRGRGRGRGPGRPPRPSIGAGGGTGGALGSAGGFGSGGPRYGGDSLLRQATGNMVRRGRGGWKLIDPDRDARDLIAAELRRWAQEEAIRRETVKNEALAYTNDTLADGDAAVVKRVLPILQGVASGQVTLPAAGAVGTMPQRKALVAVLGALREIAHLRASLELVAYPGLKTALAELAQHVQPEVKALASSTLESWLKNVLAQINVLSEPRYVEDPRPVLENLIMDRERFDPVVTAITHKTLKAPDAPGSLGFLTPGTTGGWSPAGQATPSTSTMPGTGVVVTADHAAAAGLAGGASGQQGDGQVTQQQQQQQQVMAAGAAGGNEVDLEKAPSVAMLDGPDAMGDDGAAILPPFEQQLAQEGWHGSQEADPTGIEPSGFNQTICPCNVDTAGAIKDSYLHSVLVKPLPNGARLHALIDSCHSGTIMNLPYNAATKNGNFTMWENEYEPSRVHKWVSAGGTVFQFSAAAWDELAAEFGRNVQGQTKYSGAATYAFCSAIKKHIKEWGKDISYGGLLKAMFDELREDRRFHDQTPTLSSCIQIDCMSTAVSFKL